MCGVCCFVQCQFAGAVWLKSCAKSLNMNALLCAPAEAPRGLEPSRLGACDNETPIERPATPPRECQSIILLLIRCGKACKPNPMSSSSLQGRGAAAAAAAAASTALYLERHCLEAFLWDHTLGPTFGPTGSYFAPYFFILGPTLWPTFVTYFVPYFCDLLLIKVGPCLYPTYFNENLESYFVT